MIKNQNVNGVIDLLNDDKKIVLYTSYFNGSNRPTIENSKGLVFENNFFTMFANGRTMAFVAYDETHVDNEGNVRPFGFINSWGTSGLSWMSKDDIYSHPSDLVVISIN
jgi:hypothetical protein